ITQSMSRKGNCWDNAVAESFFKTLKIEFIKDKTFKNLEEAKFEIFNYIERWYNTQRKHSAIGYLSPLQMFYKLNS
ncbi:MAG: integrase core domain-containing protein, partial [Saprospiraceae bacterium]|nr:integrase core domain-containing protein [Saprospiraceae bacterium]